MALCFDSKAENVATRECTFLTQKPETCISVHLHRLFFPCCQGRCERIDSGVQFLRGLLGAGQAHRAGFNESRFILVFHHAAQGIIMGGGGWTVRIQLCPFLPSNVW